MKYFKDKVSSWIEINDCLASNICQGIVIVKDKFNANYSYERIDCGENLELSRNVVVWMSCFMEPIIIGGIWMIARTWNGLKSYKVLERNIYFRLINHERHFFVYLLFFFKNLSIYIEYLIEVSKYLKFLLKSGDKSWSNDYAKFTITWMEKEGLLGDVENVFPAHGGRVYMSHGRFPRFLANGQRQWEIKVVHSLGSIIVEAENSQIGSRLFVARFVLAAFRPGFFFARIISRPILSSKIISLLNNCLHPPAFAPLPAGFRSIGKKWKNRATYDPILTLPFYLF